MKQFFVLLVFFFAGICLQAEFPVVGDRSDILWRRGGSAAHFGVVFHPSSSYVAAAAGAVEMFSIDGKAVKRYSGGYPLYFFKNGKLFAYITGDVPSMWEVKIVDLETDSVVFSREGTYAVSPDEKIIAIGLWDEIWLYDTETWQKIRSKTHLSDVRDNQVIGLRFLPDGKQIFITLEILVPKQSWDEHHVWDMEADTVKYTSFIPLAVSPDGTKLAYVGGSPGKLITIIDAKTNEEIGFVPLDPKIVHLESVYGVDISPDGRYMLYVINSWEKVDYLINIWDIELNTRVYVFPRNLGGYSCAFSPNGKYFAIGHSIYLFDFEKIKRKIEDATGVTEPEHAFFVYYNPYQVDYIRFNYRLEEPIPTIITVHDVFGRKVVEEECGSWLYRHNGEYGIPASRFPSGIYFVTINSGGKITTQKFVVTR